MRVAGAPIHPCLWNVYNKQRRLHLIQFASKNIGTIRKTGSQACASKKDMLQQSSIVGFDRIQLHMANSNKGAHARFCADLLTTYVE